MSDPRRPTVAPVREPVPPFLDFAPLQNGAARLKDASARFERAYTTAMRDGGTALDTASVARLNALLGQAERALAPADGLPRRPWYRQLLSAPGWYTGYSPKTMPGVREAIEDKRWKDAEAAAAALGQALEREAGVLEQAAGVLAP